MCINFTPLNTVSAGSTPASTGKERKNPKKYGANAPQLRAIRCYIDFYVMLCNEQGKNQKNTAQTLHSCAISLFVIADGFEMLFFHFFWSKEECKRCSI